MQSLTKSYNILLFLLFLFLPAKAEEIIRMEEKYLMEDLLGIAAYESVEPFKGEAKIIWYATKDNKWKPVETFPASTTTKGQLIFFYKNPKEISSDQDIKEGKITLIKEIIGMIYGDSVEIPLWIRSEDGMDEVVINAKIVDLLKKLKLSKLLPDP